MTLRPWPRGALAVVADVARPAEREAALAKGPRRGPKPAEGEAEDEDVVVIHPKKDTGTDSESSGDEKTEAVGVE